MNTELCWFSLGIAGVLSQIGGTWQKAFRRFGIPILMVATYVLFVVWNWWLLPMMVLQWGAFCLPVTLKGDGIPDHTINWLWLPVLYILTSLPPVILQPSLWFVPLITGSIMALMVALSNVPKTAKYFQWKFCELMSGIMPVYVLCLTITI